MSAVRGREAGYMGTGYMGTGVGKLIFFFFLVGRCGSSHGAFIFLGN